MRILVSGASGFVGRLLVSELERAGHDVVVLARSGTPSNERIVVPADLAALPVDALVERGPIDAAIHLAALNPDRSDRASQDETALLRANRDGTTALAKAAAHANISHFVFLSTANVHRPGDAPISETSPIAPTSPYAHSKAEAEQALADVSAKTGLRLAILRPAPVYGTGGRGMIASLSRFAHSPFPVPLPTGLAPRSFLSRASLVNAILAVLGRNVSDTETYLVADKSPKTPAEIVAGIRQSLGRRSVILPVPNGLLRVAANPLGFGRTLENVQKPFTLDWSKLARETTWVPESDTIAALLRARTAPLKRNPS
ncbi:NAD-dependent epimerase/dehydratase family protein [Fulvimarina sp. MAC8]|uniref:NAD-dependent epimerase/dehydratase family protein n=1 Tax=Fulvimarina sp. MAC8 TaxID=3162874 RepID=UPI0032EF1EF4